MVSMSATETTRTRLVMAGAFVGALVLLSLSMLFSWPVTVTRASSSSAPDEALAAFDSPGGTCLDWPADNPRAMRRLDCAQPHLFEVTSYVEIGQEYGPDAPPPDEAQWQAIANDRCTPGVAAYLGGKLDPFGKYSVSALKPTFDQWRAGDRKLRCGVHRVTATGTRLHTKGSAAAQDQSNIFEPGTCLALTDTKGIGDPIDCAQAHSVEIVGNVDLAAAFPAEFPNPDVQKGKLSELCQQAAAQYSGGRNLAEQKLTISWDTLLEESWAAGSRKVDCKVGSLLQDGSGLAQVTGSIRAAPPSGSAPAPAPPTPSTPGR
jgi:hypothetical protein